MEVLDLRACTDASAYASYEDKIDSYPFRKWFVAFQV